MNIREYIDSGILYDYAMGQLSDSRRAEVEHACAAYPEINDELLSLQASLGGLAHYTATSPDPALRDNIWDKLDNINRERTGDINTQPVINKYSNYLNWKRIVAPYMPVQITEGRDTRVIRDSGGVTQVLVVSSLDVDDEVHEHEKESFMILEGECECYVGTDVYCLSAGDFIDIPLHVSHNVKIISPYVVAVLQHIAV